MNKSLETKSGIEDGSLEKSSEKHKRLRGKSLFKIKEQMEFYFSHANLRRDRFLGNLVRSNPDRYVHAEVFLTFNQIRKLTDSVHDITKAITESSLLELSPDSKKIRVKNQALEEQNYDDCTIYVENLPAHCDYKYIKNIFTRFGSVAYVSLPRYRGSNKIKGFSFIEFNSPDSCRQACDAYKYNNRNKGMAASVHKPTFSEEKKSGDSTDLTKNKDLSPQKPLGKRKWSENEKPSEKPSKTTSESVEETTATAPVESEETQSPNKESCKEHKRRKRQSSESESGEKKRRRLISENTADESVKGGDDDEIPKHISDGEYHASKEQSSNVAHESDKDNDDETVIKKMKLTSSNDARKDDLDSEDHKKNEVVQQEDEENKMEVTDQSQESSQKEKKKSRKKRTESDKLKLRVISKAEWKHYRNQYLSMQRRSMSSLKKMLQINKKQQDECEAIEKKSLSNEKEKESAEPQVEKPEEAIPALTVNLEFQPNVIAKLKLTKVAAAPFELIKTIRAKADVAFIDIMDNKKEAFVRFRDSDSASKILKEGLLDEFGSTKMVTGAEEKIYWEKVEKDREIHLNRPKTNKRGRDKIIAKAATLMKQKGTHIHFDESF